MSQTPESTEPTQPPAQTQKVGLFKAAAGNSARTSPSSPVPQVPVAKTIDFVGVAVVVITLAQVVRAILLRGSTSQLTHLLITQNADAKTPKKNYTGQAVLDDLSSLRSGALIQAVVISAVLLLLAYVLRKTRMASGARWAMLIVIILTELPFGVWPAKNWPAGTQVAAVIAGLASIAVIVLLFMPASRQYFLACREAITPPEVRNQRGMSQSPFAGMFGGRRPVQQQNAQAQTRPTAPAKPMSGRAKSKVRSDAEAVNKGADLARSRAKASKSRRTFEG